MYPSCKKDTYGAMIQGLQWAIARSDRRRRAGITGLTLVASGGLIRLGSSERVLAPGAPKSGQRRADYVPVASAQKARQSEPRSTATQRNATSAWQGKARFGRQGAAWPQQSLLAKRT